jgi:hypothetical protein
MACITVASRSAAKGNKPNRRRSTDLPHGDICHRPDVCRTYYQLFNGILTPRQLEGLRLLLTPFPQQQFNATEDRRAELPSQGALIAIRTATKTARRTRLPMHARSGSATASRRYRFVA